LREEHSTLKRCASQAAEPGRAADTAGASLGWARSTRPMRYGLLATRQRATFRRIQRANAPRAPAVGRTRIAWHLPPACVLHAAHACQRGS